MSVISDDTKFLIIKYTPLYTVIIADNVSNKHNFMKVIFHLRSPGFEVHIITGYFPTKLAGNDGNIRRHGWV